MKIILILLFFISSFAHSARISSNSFGLNIGQTKFEQTQQPGTNVNVDGVSFGIIGNYNLYNTDSYGIDVNAEFSIADNLSGTPSSVEVEIARLDYVFRPYYQLPWIKIFADIGYSSIKAKQTSPVNQTLLDANSFLPAIGFEGSIGPFGTSDLFFAPTLDFVNHIPAAQGLVFSIPLSYSINEKFDLNANYTQSSLDSYSKNSIDFKNEFSVWSIGFDLKF